MSSTIKHKRLEKQWGRHFKACFVNWPDLKNLFQLFANFHHQRVHKAPGATLSHTVGAFWNFSNLWRKYPLHCCNAMGRPISCEIDYRPLEPFEWVCVTLHFGPAVWHSQVARGEPQTGVCMIF